MTPTGRAVRGRWGLGMNGALNRIDALVAVGQDGVDGAEGVVVNHDISC